MIGRRAALGLAVVFMLGLWLRMGLAFDALPARMASHFDGAGNPNGWQSKTGFALTAALLSALFFGLTCVAPLMIRATPEHQINLPHKEYWLAPERRAQTIERLVAWLSWFSCATLGFLAGTFELVIRANLRGTALGHSIWLLLGGYVLFMLTSSVGLVLGFRRP